MFEKIGHAAAHVATNVSRRQFLGRFGCIAMAVAASAGGLLAWTGTAEAAQITCGKYRGRQLYRSRCSDGRWICCPRGMYCYTFGGGRHVCRRGG
jgi:hypothetical protein